MAEIYTDGLDIEPTDIAPDGAPAEDMTEEAYEPTDRAVESDEPVSEFAEGEFEDGEAHGGEEDNADADDATQGDYAALAEDDLMKLRREFPQARELRSIAELDNPVRFAELRELGLSPKEAYLATQKPRAHRDNRSHLVGSMPSVRGGGAPTMTRSELYSAREIFSGMSDSEIQSLYKRVSK